MAHYTQTQFVKFARALLPQYFTGVRVLEIGSQDINGSARSLFADSAYIGIDVAPAKGVDLICKGEDYDGPSGSFDSVISFEVMEHNPAWKETFINMVRLARPGGLVLISCATVGRPEHGTTRASPHDSPLTLDWQYYRNLTRDDFKVVVDLPAQFACYGFFTYYYGSDLFFLGVKTGATEQEAANARHAVRTLRVKYGLRNCLQWDSLKPMILLSVFGESRYFAMQGRTSYGLPVTESEQTRRYVG